MNLEQFTSVIMGDRPRPKKKSRFFSGRTKETKSLLQGSGRSSHRAIASTGADVDSSSVHDEALNMRVLPHRTTPSLSSSHGIYQNDRNGLEQDSSENDPAEAAQIRPHLANAASALERLSVRDRRRDGIYGAQSLPQHNSNASLSQNANQGTAALVPGVPFQNGNFFQHAVAQHTLLPARFDVSTPQGTLRARQTRRPLLSNERNKAHTDDFVLRSPPHNMHDALAPQVMPAQQDTGPLGALKYHRLQSLHTTHHPVQQQTFQKQSSQQSFLHPHQVQTVNFNRNSAKGNRLLHPLRQPIANLSHSGITNPPFHPTPSPSRRQPVGPKSEVPANLYTSPNRIQHASLAARTALKRKRPLPILPPPAYIYSHTSDPDFNIFAGFLLYPELCFALTFHLPVDGLVSLYAISRDFHTIIDTRLTTVILGQALGKAPESSRCFQFRCYAHLCRDDPSARIPHPDPRLAGHGVRRRIPSFRWLRMILHREKVVQEIMALFAEDGVPLPARCSLAIKRLWFMFDIPDNARRIGYVHNRSLFTDLDLYFAMCFFVKLDMRCNDPVGPEKRDGLRKMLLSQTSLTTLAQVLKREVWKTRLDVLRAWVRWKYDPLPGERGMSIFGVPATEVGRLKWEYWGRRSSEQVGKREVRLLLRPDQLVMREAIRRGLRFTRHFFRCLLYGYVRPETLADYEPRKYGRRVEMLGDEYGVDDIIGGVSALGVGDHGYDELLDLGERREGSVFCITREEVSREEKVIRQKQEEFLNMCVEWYLREEVDEVMDLN